MTTFKKLSKYPTEREMWNRIKGALNHNDRRAYRVETVATPGFPDIVWITEKGVRLMELKAGKMRFRQAQIKFIKDAFSAGVNVWVIQQQVKLGLMTVLPGIEAIEGHSDGDGMHIEKWLEVMTNA